MNWKPLREELQCKYSLNCRIGSLRSAILGFSHSAPNQSRDPDLRFHLKFYLVYYYIHFTDGNDVMEKCGIIFILGKTILPETCKIKGFH